MLISRAKTGFGGIVAVGAVPFLLIWELTAKDRVVDLSLFGRRNFTVGVTALSLGMLGFFGITVVFPLWLQTTLGYTATWAGLTTPPVGILPFLIPAILALALMGDAVWRLAS